MKIKIIIPGELPDLNNEINAAKAHWANYASHKDYWTNYIAQVIREQKIPVLKTPIKPKYIWYTKDLRKDTDNISATGRKYILDGMKQAGIIPNDSRRYVSGTRGDEYFVDKMHPRVEIEI